MDSRITKLSTIVDDKTMIAQLIRENSPRVRLIEFADARADIWHFFRLVCLDGITLPYAVCIRCMKPVSYKAREGTGGLHRHPCSKHAIAAAIAAGIPFSTLTNRSSKARPSSQNSSSFSSQSAFISTKNITDFTIASTSSALSLFSNNISQDLKPLPPLNSLAALELVQNLTQNNCLIAEDLSIKSSSKNNNNNSINQTNRSQQLKTSITDNNHQLDNEDNNNNNKTMTTMTINGTNEELIALNIIKLFSTELIPLDVLEKPSFIRLAEQLISFGAINGSLSFKRFPIKSLFAKTYDTLQFDFKSLIKQLSFVTFVVDLWTQEVTNRRFMTVWIHWTQQNHCRIYVTKDITHLTPTSTTTTSTTNGQQLIKQLDSIRKEVCDPNADYVYLFDNQFSDYNVVVADDDDNDNDDEVNDNNNHNNNIMFCVSHQLSTILDELHSIEEFRELLNEIKVVVNNLIIQSSSVESSFCLKFIAQSISGFDNWFQILNLMKLLKELPNINNLFNGNNNNNGHEFQYIGKQLFGEIVDFLSPFMEALNYFHSETTTTTNNDKSVVDTIITTTTTSINLIVLWKVKLENHCKCHQSDGVVIKSMKQKLGEAIRRSRLNHCRYLMAVCFDPRFKKLKMLSQDQRDRTYTMIRKQLQQQFSSSSLSSSAKQKLLLSQQLLRQSTYDDSCCTSGGDTEEEDQEDQEEDQERSSRNNNRKKLKAFHETFTEYLDETNEEEKDELQRYLDLDVGQQTQPLEFWTTDHSSRLPRLRLLAQTILTIPPVVTRCCHYCPNGEQLSKRRQSLDMNSLDKLLVLNTHFS